MTLPVFSEKEFLQRLDFHQYAAQTKYLAMYSSWLGGVVRKPQLMLVPVDDHLVHRGDGVFEAIKTKSGKIYLLDAHVNRLFQSAQRIGLAVPMSMQELKSIIVETLRIANAADTVVRLFLSRGPGTFSVNPYDSIGAQVYVVITELQPYPADKYKNGVRVGRSQVPVKSGWMPQVKSCNYLPNVLMKKEAVDRSLDFTVAFDEEGFLAESATENIIIVDRNGALVHPPLDRILKGTTMSRLFDLAESANLLPVKRGGRLREEDLRLARETMFVGTTLDVLPVAEYEGQKIPVGPFSQKLLQLLLMDQQGSEVTTEY